MPEEFDPYRTWLGIAENERPPNHYRLLGIADFESDIDTIRDAGEARVQYLQDVSTGKHIAKAQELLNQVAAAVVCLTSLEKKLAYDRELMQSLAQVPKPKSVKVKPKAAHERPSKQVPKKSVKKNRQKHSIAAMATIGVTVLLFVAFGVWYVVNNSGATGSNKATSKRDENWKPGKLVATDFTDAVVDGNWLSSVGKWQFGEGVVINSTRDAGKKYLHLTGGSERVATVHLSDDVDRRGILTLRAERWSDTGDFEFLVQYSSDGKTWVTIPREDYGDDFKKRSARGMGASWSVIYQLDDPEMTQLRFVCNSEELNNPVAGGALIGSVKIAPRVR